MPPRTARWIINAFLRLRIADKRHQFNNRAIGRKIGGYMSAVMQVNFKVARYRHTKQKGELLRLAFLLVNYCK
jgi:hypothetical protein